MDLEQRIAELKRRMDQIKAFFRKKTADTKTEVPLDKEFLHNPNPTHSKEDPTDVGADHATEQKNDQDA